MRILFLTPQSTCQERGTPVATKVLWNLLVQHEERVSRFSRAVVKDESLEDPLVQRTYNNIPFICNIFLGFVPLGLLRSCRLFLNGLWLARKRQYRLVEPYDSFAAFSDTVTTLMTQTLTVIG